MNSEATLVLALRHELLLEALTRLLQASGLQVAGRCTNADGLERCLRAHRADIALVDTELAAGGDVAGLIGGARRALPDGHLVLLASAQDTALARATLALEVDGVLLKSAASEDVVASLQRIMAGDAVFPAGWLAAARRDTRGSEPEALSERQIEVLELLAQGLPNESIAERLFISRNTVKFHVAAIYQRLGVRNRVQAARALGALRPEA